MLQHVLLMSTTLKLPQLQPSHSCQPHKLVVTVTCVAVTGLKWIFAVAEEKAAREEGLLAECWCCQNLVPNQRQQISKQQFHSAWQAAFAKHGIVRQWTKLWNLLFHQCLVWNVTPDKVGVDLQKLDERARHGWHFELSFLQTSPTMKAHCGVRVQLADCSLIVKSYERAVCWHSPIQQVWVATHDGWRWCCWWPVEVSNQQLIEKKATTRTTDSKSQQRLNQLSVVARWRVFICHPKVCSCWRTWFVLDSRY